MPLFPRLAGVLLIACAISCGTVPQTADAQNAFDNVDPIGPIPLAATTTTQKDALADRLAYNRNTLINAYESHGSRDPKWDDDALALLEEVALHFSSAEGLKSREEIVALAEPILAAGCDDPLVTYCYAALLQDAAPKDESAQTKAAKLLRECYDGLVQRGYPASRRYAAAKRVWRRQKKESPNSDAVQQLWENQIDEALGCIAQDDASNNEGRYLIHLVDELMDALSLDEKDLFYQRAKLYEVEQPFLVNYVGGKWHMAAAWKSRGGGWAYKVTEEGWRGFHKHVAEARVCYEQAWHAAPNRPEAATEMIGVARAESESPAREMRLWFNRAVEAQIDHLPAYHSWLNGMLPRWHGSFGAMHEFGLRCKETERYDTDVPYFYCHALWRIANDSQNTQGLASLNRPGVYEEAADVCRRYVEVAPTPYNANWWKSVQLGFACCTERWQEAAATLDELDEQIDLDALGRFPLKRDTVVAEIRFRSSPRSEELEVALARGNDTDREAKLALLSELSEDETLHPLLRRQVLSRRRGLLWSADYEKGEPVTLKAVPDLHGWRVVAGAWEATTNGGLKGVSDRNGVIALCEIDLGPRWELEGRWRYGKSRYSRWDAGVILFRDGAPLYGVMHNPTKKWVAAGLLRDLDDEQEDFSRASQGFPFKLRLDDGVVDLWIGDDQAIEQKQLPGWSDGQNVNLGVGAKYTWSGSELIYPELTVQKLE